MSTNGGTRSLVGIGQRRLWAEVAGHGPTVVLEQGGPGQGVGSWPTLVCPLAEFATVVSYDRAGTGESDPCPEPRTVARMVDDLNALLHALDVELPAVFVGWSYGGLVLQMYAARFPWDVAGLVFVDPTPTERAPCCRIGGLWERGLHLLGLTGLVRTRPGERLVRYLFGQVARNAAEVDGFVEFLRDRQATLLNWRTLAPHNRNIHEVAATVADRGLPPVPLSVITAGLRSDSPKGRRMAGWMTRSHRRLAARSPHGRVLIAEKSAHQDIPSKEPELIIDAVRAALPRTEQVRA